MAGEHLDAFFGDALKAVEILPMIIEKALRGPGLPERTAYNEQHQCERRFEALVYPPAPAAFLALIRLDPQEKANELVGLYPFLRDGVPHRLEILDLKPDADQTEGVIEAVNPNAVTVTFYDPTFACHRPVYANGRKFEFSIAGLAYVLEKVENTTITVTEGPALETERQRRLEEDPSTDVSQVTSVGFSMAELRTLIPLDDGVNAEFQTVVEGVDYFQVEGTEICKMPVVLMRPAEEDFRAVLYATEHVLKGYQPKVGDSIRGTLWLQGYPLRSVEDPANWGDRLTSASPQYDMEGIMRAFATQDYLADQHPGVVVVASSCAGNGWDVTKYENPDRSPQFPAFCLERPGRRRVNVWVRAYIVGQEPALLFTPEEKILFQSVSAEYDEDAAFVTVACTDVGKGHTFKAEGLHTLEPLIGKVMVFEYLAKLEFRKVIEIPGAPD